MLARAKQEAEDISHRASANGEPPLHASDRLPVAQGAGPTVAEVVGSNDDATQWKKPVPLEQVLSGDRRSDSSGPDYARRLRELRREHTERLIQRGLEAEEAQQFNHTIRIESLEAEPTAPHPSAASPRLGFGEDDEGGLNGLRNLSDALLQKSASRTTSTPATDGIDGLGALAGIALGPSKDAAGSGELQRREDQREEFWQHGGDSLKPGLLLATVQQPVSRYVLRMGTTIPGILITGIHSESPGQILGEVSRNVYDSVNQKHLLIPSGSQLVGTYSARVAHGQERAQISWVRLNFPNGQTLDIGGMSGSDPSGRAGFHDLVDRHLWRQIGAALLGASVTVGYEVTAPRNPLGTEGALHRGIGEQLLQLSQNMQQRWAQLPPTISIRPGYRFLVVVSKDVIFPSAYADENQHGRTRRQRDRKPIIGSDSTR